MNSMSENNGGPAFPSDSNQYGPAAGMSLHDYFAAKAMQGICSHHDTWGLTGPEIADHAYRIADAMLAARGES